MFKRVIFDHWTEWATVASFAFTLTFFLFMSIRALRIRKDKAEQMSALPLDD